MYILCYAMLLPGREGPAGPEFGRTVTGKAPTSALPNASRMADFGSVPTTTQVRPGGLHLGGPEIVPNFPAGPAEGYHHKDNHKIDIENEDPFRNRGREF
jgi:hypothetical protein